MAVLLVLLYRCLVVIFQLKIICSLNIEFPHNGDQVVHIHLRLAIQFGYSLQLDLCFGPSSDGDQPARRLGEETVARLILK